MSRSRKAAIYIFVLNFLFIATMLLRNEEYSLTLVFLAFFFAFGMSLANKACFWKYFFTLFGILSSGFVFVLFGRLEPGAIGLIASGDYFNPIMFLYLSYIASAIFSFVAGRSEEKKARRLP